jgi:putative ATP-binding cassette transporter
MLRAYLRLAGGFFRGRTAWVAWSIAAAIVLLCLFQLGVQLLINLWNRYFFDALDRRDGPEFVRQLEIFVGLAVASLVCAGFLTYAKMAMQLAWRRWLTEGLVARWLDEGRHYQLTFIEGDHDNPEQRIAEDIRLMTEAAVEFFAGMLSAVLMLASFVGVLWVISGVLRFDAFGVAVAIPGYMVWMAILYAAIGSALTYAVGRPLVTLTAEKQAAEADFRFGLTRARENSEAVALLRGEADERRILVRLLDRLRVRWRRIMVQQRKVAWMTGGYAVLGTAFPVIVAAPQYFAHELTLGGLMQTATAFVHVQTALSWFVDNFPHIANWRASVGRVSGLADSLDALVADLAADDEATITVARGADDALVVRDLDIAHPDGTLLVQRATLTVKPGEHVLIKGESGTGKSTLLRAIAGLWPWGRGAIELPREGDVMFLPQRPYLPLGTLAQALVYPKPRAAVAVADMKTALERCGLGPLAERLDEEERWDNALSGGEQQRLAFARVLIHRPAWVLMDEATAALDEEAEASLLAMLREELRETAVVSIGHRPGLAAFHDRTFELVRCEEGARLMRKRRGGERGRAAEDADRMARGMDKLASRGLIGWMARGRRRRGA